MASSPNTCLANSTFLAAVFSNPLTATETAPHFLRPFVLRRIRLDGKSSCVSFPAAAVAGQSEPSFGGAGGRWSRTPGRPVKDAARQEPRPPKGECPARGMGVGGSAGASPSRGGVPCRADGGRRLGGSLALPRGCALPGGWGQAARQEPRPPEGVCPAGRMEAHGSAGASPSRGGLNCCGPFGLRPGHGHARAVSDTQRHPPARSNWPQ